MFGELPKLFDRNFAIGYFLPVAMFLAGTYGLLQHYAMAGPIFALIQTDLLIGTTLLGLLTWLGGILLLVTNRDLYRILEGYGNLNPLRLVSFIEKWHYRKIEREIDDLDEEYRTCRKKKEEFPAKSRARRNRLMKEKMERFPDQEGLLLPTAFGNTLRAFEIYPRVMYGFEAIDGWSRILAVVPKEFLGLIDNAKAQVDFWVNLGFLSIISLAELIAFWIAKGIVPPIWLAAIILLILVISPWRARRLATEWGDHVKSAFDLYRFNLLDAFGIPHPENREAEKTTWQKISQAIVYRLPDVLPEIKKPKAGVK